MSLIGPRPLLVKYLPLYNESQRRRHDVKPGLTGWAQVNGRNAITWEQRFEYDVYYVDHISFLMDLKILFQTVAVVLRHSDINSATDATMEAFTGTKNKAEGD
jgi:undecaprenyl phosphate N,N'-diacetylbacillosamine 1-phosphate transferase